MNSFTDLGVDRQALFPRFGLRFHPIFAEHDAITRVKILNAFDAGEPLPLDIPFADRKLAEQCWDFQKQDEWKEYRKKRDAEDDFWAEMDWGPLEDYLDTH